LEQAFTPGSAVNQIILFQNTNRKTYIIPMPKIHFSPQRIFIASSHPLFGKGLRSVLETRWGKRISIVGMASSVEEAIQALTTLNPDLIIVDYDDVHLNRDEFLRQFIKGRDEIRIVLLSLKEGGEGAEAIVYDRRTMAASKIEDWLEISSINEHN
jgi:chemotaxis response regulator CheB